jgi:hypothetical protein
LIFLRGFRLSGDSRNINMESTILWNVTPCSLVDFHRRFWGLIRHFLLAVDFLFHLFEPASSSETSMKLCIITRAHVLKIAQPLYIIIWACEGKCFNATPWARNAVSYNVRIFVTSVKTKEKYFVDDRKWIADDITIAYGQSIFHVIKWKFLNRKPSLLFNTSFSISFPVNVMEWKWKLIPWKKTWHKNAISLSAHNIHHAISG